MHGQDVWKQIPVCRFLQWDGYHRPIQKAIANYGMYQLPKILTINKKALGLIAMSRRGYSINILIFMLNVVLCFVIQWFPITLGFLLLEKCFLLWHNGLIILSIIMDNYPYSLITPSPCFPRIHSSNPLLASLRLPIKIFILSFPRMSMVFLSIIPVEFFNFVICWYTKLD